MHVLKNYPLRLNTCNTLTHAAVREGRRWVLGGHMLGSGELCNVLGWGRGDSQTQHCCCSRSWRKKGLSVRRTHRDSWTMDKCLRFFFSVLLLCEQLVAHCTACVWAFPWQCSCSQERQWISFAFFRITENHFAKSVLAKRTSKRTATQIVSRKSQLKMFVPTFLLWRTKCT